MRKIATARWSAAEFGADIDGALSAPIFLPIGGGAPGMCAQYWRHA
jgi:hypothetical protein